MKEYMEVHVADIEFLMCPILNFPMLASINKPDPD